MDDHLLQLDDLADRASIEAMISWAGGSNLERHRDAARIARVAHEADLTEEQREIYVVFSDAQTDAVAVRELAVASVALAHGIAVGAALGSFPEDDSEALTRLGSRVASSLLDSGLPLEVAHEVTRTTLAALTRAERVAALLSAGQVRTPGGHPLPKRRK